MPIVTKGSRKNINTDVHLSVREQTILRSMLTDLLREGVTRDELRKSIKKEMDEQVKTKRRTPEEAAAYYAYVYQVLDEEIRL